MPAKIEVSSLSNAFERRVILDIEPVSGPKQRVELHWSDALKLATDIQAAAILTIAGHEESL